MNQDRLESTLPADFDGIFRFTNFTSDDFTAKWDGKEYTFPANKMTPIIIPNATPEQIQSIRKKFARELATLVWYGTAKFGDMNDPKQGSRPALYTESDLKPFIQRCLEPLPVGTAKVKVAPKVALEDMLSKDEKGRPRSKILDDNESLVGNGTVLS